MHKAQPLPSAYSQIPLRTCVGPFFLITVRPIMTSPYDKNHSLPESNDMPSSAIHPVLKGIVRLEQRI